VLRTLVAALIVANLAFYAWTQGWLDGVVGVRSIGDREPERMTRQMHPELVRILPASDPSAVGTTNPPPTLACLEAGPFVDAEVAAAQTAAQAALAGTGVTDVKTDKPAVWIVYMGRYANREALTKKVEELKRRKLDYDEVRDNATLTPGLSLGRFDSGSAAASALEKLGQQGIHTARIIELTPASSSHMLHIETDDAVVAAQAMALKLGTLSKGFAACAKP
jgi:hypothetical protein